MIVINGDLYGTTSSGGKFGAGEIFRVTPAGNLKIVHSFGKGTDGASPWFGALIDFDGDLYGTTLTGGTKGIGTIYTSTLTGTEKVLYSFKSTASTGCEPNVGLVALNGGLYGTSIGAPTCPGNGTVYQVGGSAGITTLHKFAGGKGGGSPYGLVPMNSTLYGLTAGGGEFNQGLFYSVTP